MENANNGVMKGILVEFNLEDYDKALELYKYLKTQNYYMGGLLLDKMNYEKSRIS